MDEHYGLGPAGLAGNDDAGTLSAWFVFSALGLYPIAGSDRYILGTPAFDSARVRLPTGDLLIEAVGRDQGPYVRTVSLDGTALTEPWLAHRDISGGATLRFEMSGEPSSWGEPRE
jgi:putative alpha-1,2-mannosidase